MQSRVHLCAHQPLSLSPPISTCVSMWMHMCKDMYARFMCLWKPLSLGSFRDLLPPYTLRQAGSLSWTQSWASLASQTAPGIPGLKLEEASIPTQVWYYILCTGSWRSTLWPDVYTVSTVSAEPFLETGANQLNCLADQKTTKIHLSTHLPSTGTTGVYHTHLYMDAGDLNTGLHACKSKQFACWVISAVLIKVTFVTASMANCTCNPNIRGLDKARWHRGPIKYI